VDQNDTFSRIWAAFDAGQVLPACAWCGRLQIDDAWLMPTPAALAAIDERYTFSHSVCDGCAELLGRSDARKRSVAQTKSPTREHASG
jgi:hypothetical protein